MIQRLYSLPMYQPAVLIGRMVSDLCRKTLTFAVLFRFAYALGFRLAGGIPAALIGRTVSDLCRNIFTFAVTFGVAYAIGFRLEGGIPAALGASALLLFFGYAFSWIQAFIGLLVNSVEAANSAGFIWMFPLTFISSAFVDPSTMPSWLQPIADANPFTKVTDATRALYNGMDPGNDVWISIAWAVGITVVFALLSARKFNSANAA